MEKTLCIKVTQIDKTANCMCYESEVEETWANNTINAVFRDCQKEYGRCISSLYIDNKQHESIKIGWVFEVKKQYRDTGAFYIQHTWIELHTDLPTKTIQYHYKLFK